MVNIFRNRSIELLIQSHRYFHSKIHGSSYNPRLLVLFYKLPQRDLTSPLLRSWYSKYSLFRAGCTECFEEGQHSSVILWETDGNIALLEVFSRYASVFDSASENGAKYLGDLEGRR